MRSGQKLLACAAAIIALVGCDAAGPALEEAPATLEAAPAAPPTYVVETNEAGDRTIFPSARGVVDRTRAIRTTRSDWGPNPYQEVTCHTFHAVQQSTGDVVCGLVCSDGTIYKMSCEADIFGDGYELEIRE